MKKVLFQLSKAGKLRTWSVEARGRFITTQFGEVGGVIQTVVDEGKYKNRGASNEVTPEQDAINEARRAVLKKVREGYSVDPREDQDQIWWAEGILPQGLRFYKPDNTMGATLEKLVEGNKALMTRKRDGEMTVIVKWADGDAEAFTRTMLANHHLEPDVPLSIRLSNILEQIANNKDIPARSILLGDIVSDPVDRDRWGIAQFMRSKTDKALSSPITPFFYVWDVAFWGAKNLLASHPASFRISLIHDIFGVEWSPSKQWVLPIEVFTPKELHSLVGDANLSYTQAAMQYAKMMDWEGFVVLNPDKPIGDKCFNFRGKTYRPGTVSAKLKPVFEDDFIAKFDPDDSLDRGVYGKWGRGKHRQQVGSVTLFQINADGEEVYICECGGGIDDEFRELYSHPSSYPMTVEVEFTERTYKHEGEKTNALTYPRIVRARPDKDVRECENRLLEH